MYPQIFQMNADLKEADSLTQRRRERRASQRVLHLSLRLCASAVNTYLHLRIPLGFCKTVTTQKRASNRMGAQCSSASGVKETDFDL